MQAHFPSYRVRVRGVGHCFLPSHVNTRRGGGGCDVAARGARESVSSCCSCCRGLPFYTSFMIASLSINEKRPCECPPSVLDGPQKRVAAARPLNSNGPRYGLCAPCIVVLGFSRFFFFHSIKVVAFVGRVRGPLALFAPRLLAQAPPLRYGRRAVWRDLSVAADSPRGNEKAPAAASPPPSHAFRCCCFSRASVVGLDP